MSVLGAKKKWTDGRVRGSRSFETFIVLSRFVCALIVPMTRSATSWTAGAGKGRPSARCLGFGTDGPSGRDIRKKFGVDLTAARAR